MVRVADPSSLFASSRAAIWSVDASQALGTPVMLDEYVDHTLRPRRLLTGVIAAFAVTALLLGACGVYGVVGYRVAQRMKEIAIRVALGAVRPRHRRHLRRDTLVPFGFGVAAGAPLALAAASAIRAQLFGIDPHDAMTVVTACAVVIIAALLAAYLPARRAPRVDSIAALRVEWSAALRKTRRASRRQT